MLRFVQVVGFNNDLSPIDCLKFVKQIYNLEIGNAILYSLALYSFQNTITYFLVF